MTVRRRARPSSRAALRPAGPPPTMMTSSIRTSGASSPPRASRGGGGWPRAIPAGPSHLPHTAFVGWIAVPAAPAMPADGHGLATLGKRPRVSCLASYKIAVPAGGLLADLQIRAAVALTSSSQHAWRRSLNRGVTRDMPQPSARHGRKSGPRRKMPGFSPNSGCGSFYTAESKRPIRASRRSHEHTNTALSLVALRCGHPPRAGYRAAVLLA